MKRLTVEDDNIIREGISEYLSEFGYTVIQAKDGREALTKFNSDINLVILDIQIPFINGLEVLKEIRKKSKQKEEERFQSLNFSIVLTKLLGAASKSPKDHARIWRLLLLLFLRRITGGRKEGISARFSGAP